MTRKIYTIPSDVPFLRALAEGLVARAGGYTPELSRMLVLLPTRRACRGLRDMFLNLSGGRPLLLPRMQPIGDIDQDELDLRVIGLHGTGDIPDIPPAISPLKRLILLSRLIAARHPDKTHEQSLKLAASLATLIDQVHTEDLDFSRLQTLVPDELSEHWQGTLQFLTIVTDAWPRILEDERLIDPADRRNQLMKALAGSWEKNPPPFPVIAAGSTGSIPATARLLGVVSNLPQGAVILPGLDLELDEPSWDALTDTHPQATMRSLLNRLETERRRVEVWPQALSPSAPRRLLARELMRPSETVSEWGGLSENTSILQESLEGIDLIESRTPSEEAQTIAVVMRATLEEPGKTAALITPDRALARRVCSALRKWDIPVDDSAGKSLFATNAGHFLECIFACVEEEFSPASLLNLLKHQRCKLASPDEIATLEIKLCRGPRPAAGLEGLQQRLEEPIPALTALLEKISSVFGPLSILATGDHKVSLYAEALTQIAEILSGERDAAWQNEDGEAANALLSEFLQYADLFPVTDIRGAHGILRQLMQGVPVRHPVLHPRLIILGQLEARMIQADVMILGGLNEGSWPADAGNDPWMSRPMRKSFGLPSPERSIGLSAHDFVQALCNPRVIVTRSLKVEGAPTVASRWLQRLDTMLGATGIALEHNVDYAHWAAALQHGKPVPPASRPEPRPPVAKRPHTLSATWVERWVRNPYQVHVRKILKLSPLDPLDQDTTASERGSLVHDVMKDFLTAYPRELPPAARDIFLSIAREKMDASPANSARREYWWPRLERLADWVVMHERKWREEAMTWLQEAEGKTTIPFARGAFTLTARADRIDRMKSGGAAIIDYKTGQPPTAPSINSGEDCQLPLEGLILQNGGYGDIRDVSMFSYWKLLGSDTPGKPKNFTDTSDMIRNAADGLKDLVDLFESEQTPYIAKPPRNPKRMYDDEKAVAHLARMQEWSSADDDGEDAA